VRYAIQKHTAAAGSSNASASKSAVASSLPWLSRTTSNHASVSSSVPVAAASAPTHGERRCAANAVAQKQIASPTSKPDQAMSQCAEWCEGGSDADSQNAHGSSPIPTVA
jgi:hypothetical protein